MEEELSIVEGFVTLDAVLKEEINKLIKSFPSWDFRVDERILVLVKLRSFVRSGKLALLLKQTCLENPIWWKSVEPLVSECDRQQYCASEFDIFARFAMFQGLFSIYEAAIRSITAAITCTSPPNTIYDTRTMLLKKLLSLRNHDKNSFSNLLKFVGQIRNCIHNNMVHTGKDETIVYRESEFEFRRNKPPEFLSWTLFIHITFDIAEMFRILVQTPEISGLPEVPSFVDLNLGRSTDPV